MWDPQPQKSSNCTTDLDHSVYCKWHSGASNYTFENCWQKPGIVFELFDILKVQCPIRRWKAFRSHKHPYIPEQTRWNYLFSEQCNSLQPVTLENRALYKDCKCPTRVMQLHTSERPCDIHFSADCKLPWEMEHQCWQISMLQWPAHTVLYSIWIVSNMHSCLFNGKNQSQLNFKVFPHTYPEMSQDCHVQTQTV